MTKISVVIIADGCRENIEISLRSLEKQSYKEWEALIISTYDKSQLSVSWSESINDRCRILYLDDIERRAVRAAAVRYANGKYVLFLEAGDELVPTALEHLLRLAEKTSSDLVMYEWYELKDGQRKTVPIKSKISNESRLLVDGVLKGKHISFVWSNFYTKELLEKAVTESHTDELMLVKDIFSHAHKAFYMPSPLYLHQFSEADKSVLGTSAKMGLVAGFAGLVLQLIKNIIDL